MREELDKEIAELAMASYRLGMVNGSRQEYFLNGRIYNFDELYALQQEQMAKVKALLEKIPNGEEAS